MSRFGKIAKKGNRRIMKRLISAFILVVLGIVIFSSTTIQASAAVTPTSKVVSDGIYYIRNQRSGLYLDVYREGTTNHTEVKQDYYNGGDNQRFQLKYISPEVFEIIPLHATGMRLDVHYGLTGDNVPINIYESNSSDAQRFKIVSTGNGDNSFKILTAISGYTKCMTAQGAVMTPVNVIQYTYTNNGNQDNDHWYFEDVTLNEKILVYLSAGETKSFEFTVPDDKYYAIETTQYGSSMADTYLSVSNLSTGNAYDDDGGVVFYSYIGFSNQGGRNITISVRLHSPGKSGRFYLQIRKQKAVYYGFDYDDISTIEDLNKPYDAFSALYDSYKYENEIASHFYAVDERGCYRYNSEIMFFSGHGAESGAKVKFGKTDFPNSKLGDMNNVRVAVWSACYSANTENKYNTSFVNKSVACGAKSAIGFSDTVPVISARSFTNNLFKKLAEGYTVGAAAEYAAKQLILPWDNAKDYIMMGDSGTKLTEPNYTKSPSTSSQNDIEANYYDLISNNEYVSYYIGDATRYYLTINGIITNQFVDVASKDAPQAIVTQNYDVSDKITVLPILYKYDTLSTSTEEKHLVYVVKNNVATPVLISYVTITDENGATRSEVICRNLNNGENIDYGEINSIKEDNNAIKD